MYLVIKRFFDVGVAVISLVILTPILLPIAILLALTGEHYIFYRQERMGYQNKKFRILKFASMLKDSKNMEGGIITVRNDPRMTPLGPFLRRTKINELPQIINIIIGDMSLVGPRPVMPESFAKYPNNVQEVIYNVKPGITGIGSIVFRDEEELITKVKDDGGDIWQFYSEVIYPHKGELENWYQKNQSFVVDLKIIFLTAWVILRPSSELLHTVFKSLPERNY